jgi:Tfp pilus assembly protein PilO
MEDRAKQRVELEQRLSILEHDLPVARETNRIAAEVLANGNKSKERSNLPNPTESQFLAWKQDLQRANEKYERVRSELSDVKAALAKLINYRIQPR